MSKILSEKQINLVTKSTVCDNDLELKNVLIKFNKGIEKNQLEEIKSMNKDAFYKLNSREIIKYIIEDSAKEWIQEKPMGVVDIPCQLCKNPSSKEKFIIKNLINKNELLVGTSCIEKFGGMKRMIQGEKLRDVIKLYGENSEKYDRLKEFNKMYDGGKAIIDEWDYFYNSFEIMFPKNIQSRWDEMNRGAKRFYKDYKNGKMEKEDLKKFNYYIIDFEKLKQDINIFYEKNRHNKFICTKKIEKELEKQKLNKTLDDIKENGAILKEWHIKYVGDTDFIKQFHFNIDKFMRLNSITLLSIEERKIKGEIVNGVFEGIKILLNTSDFTKNFPNVISNDNFYKVPNLANYFDIFRNRDNIFRFINVIENIFKKYKYYIEMDDDMYDLRYFEIFKDKKFAKVEIEELLNKKNKFIKNDNIDIEIKLFINNLTWNDIKDKSKFDIGNVGKIKSGINYK